MRKRKISAGVKSSVVYTLSSLFSKGLAIITVPIFTRLMSTSEIGVVNLFNSWYSMISVVATLALTSGGFQLSLKEFKNERNQYVSSVLTLTSMVAVLFAIVYCISPPFWNNITGLSTGLMLLMMLELLLSPAQQFWLLRQRYEYKYKAVAVVTFLSALFAALISVWAVIYGAKSGAENLGEIRLYANYAVLLSVAFVLWIRTYIKGKTFCNKQYWKFSLALSIPLIGNSIATQVLSVSDRTMIGKMVGNSEVGIYSTLYTVSSLSLIIWQAINSSFIPYLYDNFEKKEKRKEIKTLATKLLAAFSVVAFLLTMMAPEIVRILATKEYYEAIYIMPPIAAGVFLTSVSNMYSNVLIYHKKTNYIMISSIIAAVVNVVLNYFGIKMFGYLAAAYTTLIAYIILGMMQAIISGQVHRKITGDKTDSVYDTKMILGLSVVTIICCVACLGLYKTTILRYAILRVLCIIVCLKRKQIIKIFNK